MIRFTLECDNAHSFESWFQSNGAFDALATAGHLSCPNCASTAVRKSMMAPRIATDAASPPDPGQPAADRPLANAPADSEVTRAIAKLRKLVEANSEDVGGDFVREARAIHVGDKPQRAIYGQASADEARALIDDGVPVAPLPFIPTRRTN